jgi:two-component system CheB/CheR fusion protein
MVFHELATNAAKYGALSDRSGKVDVSWRTLDGALEVEWREHDGPPVKQPQHSGFGLSLLKGEIGYRLGGKVETNFHSDGLEVRLSFPLERK